MRDQFFRHFPALPATSSPTLASDADGLIRAFVAIDLRLSRFRARLDAFAVAQDGSSHGNTPNRWAG